MIHRHAKVVVFISAVLLLASLSTLGIFFHKLGVQKAAYHSMRAAEAERVARHAALTSLLSTFEKTQESREEVNAHILTEAGVIDLLSLIETIGRESGVVLSTDELRVESVDARFERLIASISVEGSYSSVVHVLKLLEQLPYEARIETADLTQDLGMWKGVFDVHILKFKSV